MKKTRVYVEQSDVDTKYHAQIEGNLFGFTYWRRVSTWLFKVESKSHWTIGNFLNRNSKDCSKEYAEAVCSEVQRRLKKKEDKRTHNKTKKVWSYLFPDEES